MNYFLIAVAFVVFCSSCSVQSAAPTLTNTFVPTKEPTAIPTLTPTSEPSPTPSKTPSPTSTRKPTLTPSLTPTTGEKFTNSIGNLYKLLLASNKDGQMSMRFIELAEDPNGGFSLVFQVKGVITEETKGATLGYLLAVIGKVSKDAPSLVPGELNQVVIEFFDYNDQYSLNWGLYWSDVVALLSRSFTASDLMRIVHVDLTQYKK